VTEFSEVELPLLRVLGNWVAASKGINRAA
jgi:hypothetical protein